MMPCGVWEEIVPREEPHNMPIPSDIMHLNWRCPYWNCNSDRLPDGF